MEYEDLFDAVQKDNSVGSVNIQLKYMYQYIGNAHQKIVQVMGYKKNL